MTQESPHAVREDELRDWLVLMHTPGLGPARFGALLERFGSPRSVLEAPAGELPVELVRQLRKPASHEVDADLAWRDAPDKHIVTLHDPRYPTLLRQIADPPPVLFVHGDPGILSGHLLAMVGSRNPSSGGRRTAFEFARHLAGAGLVITSGLALGVDGAAHRGALAAGGPTVAVLGTGPDRVYPAAHRELAHEVVEQGALVSEFPPGTTPRPEHFPRRNRLISGLSLGTLVVEAALRSGSLITARHAVEQGREVFAIPGSIHNPLARGCHALIRQGAKLVETADDILEELGSLAAAGNPAAPAQAPEPATELTEEYSQLIEIMGYDPVTIDQMVQASGLTAEAISSMLLILELRGYVTCGPGGRYARTEYEALK